MFEKLLGLFGNKKVNKSVQTTFPRFMDTGTQTDAVDLFYAIDVATSTSDLQIEAYGNKKRRNISTKRIPPKKSKFQ